MKITHGRNLNWYISATDPDVCLLSNENPDTRDPYRGVLLQHACTRHYKELPLSGFMLFGVVRTTGLDPQLPGVSPDRTDITTVQRHNMQSAKEKRTEMLKAEYEDYI